MYFFYDSYGNLTLIKRYINGSLTDFPVLTNSQGDVVAIYNTSGTKLYSYEYDAWGNAKVIKEDNNCTDDICTLNPIRYRGYYYDSDLELYYLQSRYYDAEIGRFINADGTLNGNGDIIGFNMFAYCSNNPVMFSDPSGCECICITHRVRDGHVCNDPENMYVVNYSEHKKKGTTNPANKNKHQKGKTRKQRDRHGGEKGDAKRPENRSNKRHSTVTTETPTESYSYSYPSSYSYSYDSTIDTIGIAGASIAVIYFISNDVTIAGVADDILLIPVVTFIWDSVVV